MICHNSAGEEVTASMVAGGIVIAVGMALAESHRLGIEYLACDNALHEGEPTLGWYRSFKSPLSLKIVAGRSLGSEPDARTQIELSWLLR